MFILNMRLQVMMSFEATIAKIAGHLNKVEQRWNNVKPETRDIPWVILVDFIRYGDP